MEQSCIHQSDRDQAIQTLTELVKTDKGRQPPMEIAQQIVFVHTVLNQEEDAAIALVFNILKLKSQLR